MEILLFIYNKKYISLSLKHIRNSFRKPAKFGFPNCTAFTFFPKLPLPEERKNDVYDIPSQADAHLLFQVKLMPEERKKDVYDIPSQPDAHLFTAQSGGFTLVPFIAELHA